MSQPIIFFLPARDEEPTVARVVARMPERIGPHPVVPVVVDDASTDGTSDAARAAGAEVVPCAGAGLGAGVRTGLHLAVERRAVAVAFCDADLEYDPAELERLVRPILDGDADYVVGSRFAGGPRRMRHHRRAGNVLLTALTRWASRAPVTDGQSGFRALSAAAAADATISHDYNYAQVLTLELLGAGHRYHEVPISYRHRTEGRSFVRLLPYLRRVLPQVWRLRIRPASADTPATEVAAKAA